jgi:hypothetical protein
LFDDLATSLPLIKGGKIEAFAFHPGVCAAEKACHAGV